MTGSRISVGMRTSSCARTTSQSTGRLLGARHLVVARRSDVEIIGHDAAADEVLNDDAACPCLVHSRVPDVVRVDDNHRPMAALVQAPRPIDANGTTNSGCGDFPFERRMHLARLR